MNALKQNLWPADVPVEAVLLYYYVILNTLITRNRYLPLSLASILGLIMLFIYEAYLIRVSIFFSQRTVNNKAICNFALKRLNVS